MTTNEPVRNKQLQNALRSFIAEQQAKKDAGEEYVKNVEIGHAVGYNGGAIISQYLNDDKPFQANIVRFEENLSNYLNFEVRAETFREKRAIRLINRRSYVPTSISEDICAMIEYCRMMQGIVILHGEAGTGKTMAARKYVRNNKGAAHYIRVEEGRIRKREVIIAIAEALGVRDARNVKERYQAIREKLHRARKVLIFDEAHRFPLQTLEFIRDLAEEDEDQDGNIRDGAGVVLIGNSKVSKFIQNVKRDDMEQFRNRSIWDREYLRRNITLDDVKLVFPYLVENGMDEELNVLWRMSAKQVWGLRGAVNIYNNAANDGDVSLASLQSVGAASKIGIIDQV